MSERSGSSRGSSSISKTAFSAAQAVSSYAGQWLLADNRYNLFHLAVSVSGCALDGFYTGLGAWSSGPFNDRLFASMDDEEQTALQLSFLSP